MNCNYCYGEKFIHYKDDMNYAFVYRDGLMIATAKDRTIHFRLKYCPMCGREFPEYKALHPDDNES